MSTAAETKLLLAIVSSAELKSTAWNDVGKKLDCNDKAAHERFRKFKLKLPLTTDHKAIDAEAQLLLAIVSCAQVTGVDWTKVGNELGCNDKAARERYRKFRMKLEKGAEGGEAEKQGINVDFGAGKKCKAAGTPTKRKATLKKSAAKKEDGGELAELKSAKKSTPKAKKEVKSEVKITENEDAGAGDYVPVAVKGAASKGTAGGNAKKPRGEQQRAKYEDQVFDHIITFGDEDSQAKNVAQAEKNDSGADKGIANLDAESENVGEQGDSPMLEI